MKRLKNFLLLLYLITLILGCLSDDETGSGLFETGDALIDSISAPISLPWPTTESFPEQTNTLLFVDDQLTAVFLQVGCYAAAHDSKSNKTNFHTNIL